MSTTTVGEIGLNLIVNKKQFEKQMVGVQKLAAKTGKLLAGAFTVKKIIDFGKECLELGSDLQEVQNVVDVTFPSMSTKVDEFAKSAASSFGLSETMAKKYTGTFGSMAKAFGFTESAAYDMGSTLTGLAGDVASFYNITQDEAYTKLKSVFTGETESLKDLGVVMTQSALDAYALANGFGKTTSQMSEAEKVALRYKFVMNQLSAASGDFARTSDGWANQVRVLKLQMESFMASVGQGLINLFTPAIRVINTLMSKLVSLANAFKSFTEMITGKAQSSISSGMDGITESATSAQEAVSGIGDSAKEAAKKAMGLGKLDELNNISTQSDSSSGSGGGSGGSSSGSSSITDPTAGIDENKPTVLEEKFNKLAASLDRFKQSADRLVGTLKDGLSWCYENILKPLGEWTITEVAPRVLDILASSFDVLNGILIALQPLWQWVWDNLLLPIANFAGDAFLSFLDGLNAGLSNFADWCANNPKVIETVATIVASFFAAWKIVSFVTGIAKIIAAIAPFITTIINIVTSIKSIQGAIVVAKAALSILVGAFNPVVLIIGAVIAAGVLLIKNWDTVKEVALKVWDKIKEGISVAVNKIKEVFGSIAGWFKEKYEGIKNVFKSIGSWFGEKFTAAYNAVKKPFQSIGTFFSGIYNTVTSKFKAIGTAVGNAIGGAFKSVINGVLSTIENTVNKAIRFINSAIDAINKIPGVNIGKLSTVKLPRLAQGGYVEKNTPQLAMIGDNRHQGEVVAPEDKLRQMAMEAAQMVKGSSNNEALLLQMIELLQRQVELLAAILEKETGISGKDIFETTRKYAQEYMKRTGNPAFDF